MDSSLRLENLYYRVPYGESILEGVSFELAPGEILGVLGKNGSGKTTLIDLILGSRNPTSGTISVLGHDPHSPDRIHIGRIAYLSHDIGLKGNLTISQFLNFHASFYPSYNLSEQQKICEFLKIDPSCKIGALSTGQQKKIQIVAGLSAMPELVIVDEITAVLDLSARGEFFELLLDYRKRYQTSVLLATNIAEDLIGVADRVIFISDKTAQEHPTSHINSIFGVGECA